MRRLQRGHTGDAARARRPLFEGKRGPPFDLEGHDGAQITVAIIAGRSVGDAPWTSRTHAHSTSIPGAPRHARAETISARGLQSMDWLAPTQGGRDGQRFCAVG